MASRNVECSRELRALVIEKEATTREVHGRWKL